MLRGAFLNVGWRAKIVAISLLFVVGIVAVGLVGAYQIHFQNKELQDLLGVSHARVNAAMRARDAIVEMARAQVNLLMAEDAALMRDAAIHAIRASAALDENIHQLHLTLAGDETVESLVAVLERIKPVRMAVIRAARSGDQARAVEQNTAMQSEIALVSDLSQQIVDKEHEAQNSLVRDRAAAGEKTIVVVGTVVIAVSVLGFVLSWVAGGMMTRPLFLLERSMAAMATGDLSLKLRSLGNDEIGRTIRAMSGMIADLHAMVGRIQSGASQLKNQAELVACTADNIHSFYAILHDSVKAIKQEAGNVLSTAHLATEELERAAVKAETTVEVAHEGAAQIMQTANHFGEFQQHVQRTAETTRELQARTQAISSITNTIREISGQTNLLALNAAIEAARAGEQGRGFAVVADEVRELATRTDKATGEIAALVEGIVTSIGQTVEQLEQMIAESNESSSVLQSLAEATADNSTRVTDIQVTVRGVVERFSEQDKSMEKIDGAVQDLFALSTDTNEQTELLHRLSSDLRGAASELNAVTDKFKL